MDLDVVTDAKPILVALSDSPEAYFALDVWDSCQTQWRVGPVGATGLDYQGVKDVAEILGIDLTPEVFGFIQQLELAAIEEMPEKR